MGALGGLIGLFVYPFFNLTTDLLLVFQITKDQTNTAHSESYRNSYTNDNSYYYIYYAKTFVHMSILVLRVWVPTIIILEIFLLGGSAGLHVSHNKHCATLTSYFACLSHEVWGSCLFFLCLGVDLTKIGQLSVVKRYMFIRIMLLLSKFES